MLDDDDSISLIHQLLEDDQKLSDVFAVKAGGRFIQDVEGISGAAAHELGRQFHSLGFAAGHGGGRLSQMDVAEADLLQGLQFPQDLVVVFKERHGFIDGHIQHIGDVLALVADFERLSVVPGAVADFTGDVNV